MNQEHVITDELFNEAQKELAAGNKWIAYNTISYFLDKGSMFFFNKEDEAREFSSNQISEFDDYKVIKADSIISLMRQLPYGDDIHFNLSERELEDLFKSFDWNDASYDPLHDTIEASTDQEKEDLARMETLLTEWENLYNKDPEAALNLAATYWDGKPMESYKDEFIKLKIETMIEKNLEYLKTNIRNHGFGDTLGPELEAQLAKGAAEFTLTYKTEVNKKEMEATLYFKKSDTTDMYFFNKYDTKLKSEKDESMAQTFYINKGWGVTLKEAYNLLNGRPVHKELTNKEDQKYQAWIQLDFNAKDKNGNYERKQYHENYGYDLKEALSFYPIKEMMKEEDMKALIKSLEKGNVQMVTLETPGKDIKVFMEANPQYKSVTLYDNKMKRMDQDQRQEMMAKPSLKADKDQSKEQSQDQSKDQKKDNKKSVKNDDDLDGPKKKGRKKGLGV
jgi:hypothetical protein